jgi:hypothetical protein
VKAPVVRGRGPLAGRAEIGEASASGKFDDLDAVSLTTRPLAAGAVGSWIVVPIVGESVPLVRLGDAEALLVLGPGATWQDWLDERGRVDGGAVAAR